MAQIHHAQSDTKTAPPFLWVPRETPRPPPHSQPAGRPRIVLCQDYDVASVCVCGMNGIIQHRDARHKIGPCFVMGADEDSSSADRFKVSRPSYCCFNI